MALDGFVPTGTSTARGILEVDGTTLTVTSAGVASAVNTGTVSSVAVTVPADESVSVTNPTGAVSIAISRQAQNGNLFLASPNGLLGTPTFRAIVPADVPVLSASGASHAAGLAPDPGAVAGSTRFLREDSTWAVPVDSSDGTVTSVALTAPSSLLSVGGSPITTSGTLALSLALQSAHSAFLGPLSGVPAAPTFRAIASSDLPVFTGPGNPGIVPDSTGQAGNYLRADGSWAQPTGTLFHLSVEDGTTTLTDRTTIHFTSGATVSAGATGVADVAIPNPGWELTDGTTDLHGVTKVTVGLMTVGGSAAAATLQPVTFGGAGLPGVVPDPITTTGHFLRDDGTWGTPGTGPSGNLTVTDGTTAVSAVSTLRFGAHLAVTDAGGGEADVAWTNPGMEITDGTHDLTGVTKVTVSGATVGGTSPNATLTVPHLAVSDGSTTVTPATTLTFTSGGTVTDAGGGVADVAITAPGITVVQGADTQTNVHQVTFVGATLSGSSPSVTVTIPTPGTLTLKDAGTTVSPVDEIDLGTGLALTDLGSGKVSIAPTFVGLEVSDGTHDQTQIGKLVVTPATATFSGSVATVVLPTFGGAGVPGLVPDPVTQHGYFLRDDASFDSAGPAKILDYTETGDVANGVTYTAATFQAVGTNHFFTKASGSSLLEVIVNGYGTAVSASSGNVVDVVLQAVIDPGGSQTTKAMGGAVCNDTSGANCLQGGSFYVDGIAAGAHTLALQLQAVQHDALFTLRCASASPPYALHIMVVEHAP